MANPNLLNATSIYGKNASVAGNNGTQTVLTCPTDKLIKIISITVHADSVNVQTGVTVAGRKLAGGATENPKNGATYSLGSFYLMEAETVTFFGDATSACLVSYEEIDDA